MKPHQPVVVIGGGHNGLCCAALLAKAGRKVMVLEARPRLGGLGAREPFGEVFHAPGVLHDATAVPEPVVAALGLGAHGLRRRPQPVRIAAPQREGETLWLAGEAVEGPVAEGDRERYRAWRAWLGRLRPAIGQLLGRAPLDPTAGLWPLIAVGRKLRGLGATDLLALLRAVPLGAADWLRSTFASERLCATLALPAALDGPAGPAAAGSALGLLLREAVTEREILGGPAALSDALVKAAEAHGVELRVQSRVARIEVTGGAATGVTLADGETIAAAQVVSSCDPKTTLLALVGARRLPARLGSDLRRLRARGATACLRLGLSRALTLADGTSVEALRTGGSVAEIERAFAAARRGRLPARPVLDVRCWSGDEVAPAGGAVATILVGAVPRVLAEGSVDATRARLLEAAVAVLGEVCPTVAERIVASEVLLPSDLDERYGLAGGHLGHGEQALDQSWFMRPTSDCAHYRTPVDGLWLCGSGCHPGGILRGAPGALGARALLKAKRR